MPVPSGCFRNFAVAFLLLLATGKASARETAVRCSAENEVVERAIGLLPQRLAVRVVVIDPDLAVDAGAIRRLDAFTVREVSGELRPVIYINCESATLRRALGGEDLFVKVLAAVIHHEAQHLNGAGEAEARRLEVLFFQQLIAGGFVDPVHGLRYLAALAGRDGPASPVNAVK